MKCGFKPILKNSHQINYKSRVVEVTCARSSALSLRVHSFDFHPSVKGNGKKVKETQPQERGHSLR